jgi:hypothetical protein
MHPDVKTFGLSILGGIAGYVVGLFGGMALVSVLSSNTHDKSMEVVTTGIFATGPLVAMTGQNVPAHRSSLRPSATEFESAFKRIGAPPRLPFSVQTVLEQES